MPSETSAGQRVFPVREALPSLGPGGLASGRLLLAALVAAAAPVYALWVVIQKRAPRPRLPVLVRTPAPQHA